MSFGGTTDPCAVGCVYSIGQINQENNAAVTLAVSELLEKHGGVANNRIYINFFDVPRANCGCAHAKNLDCSCVPRVAAPALTCATTLLPCQRVPVAGSGRTFAG